MDLNKTLWTEADRIPFLTFLKSFEQSTKIEWSRKILNTQMPLLAMPMKTMDTIVTAISKGNYRSFLDLHIDDYYESVAIQGKLITKIKDFIVMKQYLNRYATIMENWAHVDLLSFDIHEDNQQDFIELSHTYAKSTKPFIRRLNLMILFQMVKNPETLPIIFKALETLTNEKEYYVIMMAGWLLSECIIRYKDKSIPFIQKENLNPKVVNKGIQKCRESRRLTPEEKDELLAYKR